VSPTLAGATGLLALFMAVLALVFAIQANRALRETTLVRRKPADGQPQPRRGQSPGSQAEPPTQQEPEPAPDGRPTTVKGELRQLRKDLGELRVDLSDALRHLAVVRYDAFGDTGGQLSWSMALLDDNGNGVVLTSINSRSDARSYAKNVREYVSESKLSPEEAEAIDRLRRESAADS